MVYRNSDRIKKSKDQEAKAICQKNLCILLALKQLACFEIRWHVLPKYLSSWTDMSSFICYIVNIYQCPSLLNKYFCVKCFCINWFVCFFIGGGGGGGEKTVSYLFIDNICNGKYSVKVDMIRSNINVAMDTGFSYLSATGARSSLNSCMSL